MVAKIVFRIVLAIILIGAVAGLGYYTYQVGLNQGLATSIQAPANGTAPVPYPYYGFGHMRPFMGFGYGLISCLIPLFLLFIILGAIRGLLFMGMRRRMWGRGMWGHGPWGHGMWGHGPEGKGPEGQNAEDKGPEGRGPWGHGPDFVPPFFEEWHKRSHEKKSE
jgi:hypothetical protein